MPIARRSLGAASLVAALNFPAVPASAVASSCTVSGFTARSQADLAKISVLDPGPLAPDLPALADVRLAVARGAADSSGRAVATGRYAGSRVLGIPVTDAAAVHRAPSRDSGPVEVDLAGLNAGGLATVKVGKATATASWDDLYRCGKTGPLTRSATMLGGVSVLSTQAAGDGRRAPARTSLLRIGPAASTQSATDLVRLRGGLIGVRAGAGAALSDLSLFAGTPQEVSIRVLAQPTLEVTAAADPALSKVDHRPAVLEVNSGGKTVTVLKDAGADIALSLLGETQPLPRLRSSRRSAQDDRSSGTRPAVLAVRLSLGKVRGDVKGRQVRAEASTLRVEVKLGRARLLDVALGHLAVEACAPQRSRSVEPPVPTPAGSPPGPGSSEPLPVASVAPSASLMPAAPSSPSPEPPVAVGDPVPGGTGGGGSGGGELALTGANVAAFGAGGVGLVVAGLVAMLLGRRRRED